MMQQQQASHDRLELITERRKLTTEIENKKRQLEDDRRNLQYQKSKALRERWLLEGAPSTGPDQDHFTTQLEQDEAKTRNLEESIHRLEQELLSLGSGLSVQTLTQSSVAPVPHEEVKVQLSPVVNKPREMTEHIKREVKVHQSSGVTKPREMTEHMKRAMYSVEIKVERDNQTGETRILSTNTTFPVDLSHQAIKVYEDEQKVVHEMNGEDGIHLLSSSEVDELIYKADEASMMSQTVATVTSLPSAECREGAEPQPQPQPQPELRSVRVPSEITGVETKPLTEASVGEASAENPVTMVFMGYQSVEDEDETKRVLGLQGTVKAEVVVIDDTDETSQEGETSGDVNGRAQTSAPHPTASTAPSAPSAPSATSAPPPTTKPPEATPPSNGEQVGETAGKGEGAGEAVGAVVELKKKKQPCKCCSVM